MVYRQKHQLGRDIPCAHYVGDPVKPVREHERCFRREWDRVLHEIACACLLVTDSCAALLALDPLSKQSDGEIERHIDVIRPVLSDPALPRRMHREREREAFGRAIAALRKQRGWSVQRLARECAKAARLLGFGLRAPDPYQLMDYERGRSNAHTTTKYVLAAAFEIAGSTPERVGQAITGEMCLSSDMRHNFPTCVFPGQAQKQGIPAKAGPNAIAAKRGSI
jgi:transcriptional regulator with XRE-family HTH domain